MRLKHGYILFRTDGIKMEEVLTETISVLPKLMTHQDFIDGKEGYTVWSSRKQCLLFPAVYNFNLIKKSASTVQSQV